MAAPPKTETCHYYNTQYESIRNLLTPFPSIQAQLRTCEDLVRSIKGYRILRLHECVVRKFLKMQRKGNETPDPVFWSHFLDEKIKEYTTEREKKSTKSRDEVFGPGYRDVAITYLNAAYSREQLTKFITNCPNEIKIDLYMHCDLEFLSRFPEYFKNADNRPAELRKYRNNRTVCHFLALIEYALSHPSPQETLDSAPCNLLGILATAAAASAARDAEAERHLEAPISDPQDADPQEAYIDLDECLQSLYMDSEPRLNDANLNDGADLDADGFGSAQPEQSRTEGELPLSLPLANAPIGSCHIKVRSHILAAGHPDSLRCGEDGSGSAPTVPVTPSHDQAGSNSEHEDSNWDSAPCPVKASGRLPGGGQLPGLHLLPFAHAPTGRSRHHFVASLMSDLSAGDQASRPVLDVDTSPAAAPSPVQASGRLPGGGQLPGLHLLPFAHADWPQPPSFCRLINVGPFCR